MLALVYLDGAFRFLCQEHDEVGGTSRTQGLGGRRLITIEVTILEPNSPVLLPIRLALASIYNML
jgi:hypothetical protein